YKNSAGEQFTSSVENILTHVFMHGSYHRGQVASLVRAGGDTPSPTDYIFFTRGSPAATRQQ
ncbi:MAG: DinB family protein, partial [Gemmatimonadaceae bacterium]